MRIFLIFNELLLILQTKLHEKKLIEKKNLQQTAKNIQESIKIFPHANNFSSS